MVKLSKPFLMAVALPTIIIGIFFGFLATPIYRSTTTIMVSNLIRIS